MDEGTAIGLILIIILVIAVIALASLISAIVVGWQLFEKAGEAGWKILIPVYNVMIMAKIGSRPKWVGITTGILTVVSYLFGNGGGENVAVTLLSAVITLVMLGFFVYILIGCSRKYTNGVLIWLLWWLLPFISLFFVKKVTYIGDGTAGVAATAQMPAASANSPQPVQPMATSPQPVQPEIAGSAAVPVAPQMAQPQVMQPAPQVQSSDLSQTFMPTQNSDSLVAYYLGFVGLLPFIGLPFAVAALVFANKAMAKYRLNPTPGAKGHAITGRVLAIISLVLWLGIPLLLFLIGIIASSTNS